MRNSIFGEPIEIKNRKAKEIALILFTFIVVPIVSVLIICSGKQSALYNSLSRLAWPEGLLWLVYIWGIFNMGNFFFAMKMALDDGGYTKKWHKLFFALFGVSAFLLTAGVSIPAYVDRGPVYEAMRTAHTAISTVGFFGFYFIEIFLILTTVKRNNKQFLIGMALVGFTLILGVFSLTSIFDPSSYCVVSAPAQMILFMLYNIGVTYLYTSMSFFKNEHPVAVGADACSQVTEDDEDDDETVKAN